jgi:uncharacterized NAD-dependent epimerase/dehydratase family protein
MKNYEGNAIIYCEGAFHTPNGKTAHELVRFTKKFKVLSVIDSNYDGKDSGFVLDGVKNGIPIVSSLTHAFKIANTNGNDKPTHFIVGLSPSGGRLNAKSREDVRMAVSQGLHIISGLNDFLTEDEVLRNRSIEHDVKIRDIRKPPKRGDLHRFSGKIGEVKCLKIAVLGTDTGIGKLSTAWKIIHGLEIAGKKAELIGTGHIAWMQGAKYSIVLDSLIQYFIAGEIEHIIYEAWQNEYPDVVVIEGQGSIMDPVHPSGQEILAAARPDIIVLQHDPERTNFLEFPQDSIRPILQQIQVIELLSGKKVAAIALNTDSMDTLKVDAYCKNIKNETGIETFNVHTEVDTRLIDLLLEYLK